MRRRGSGVGLLAWMLVIAAGPAAGQVGSADEVELLRDASVREASGDLTGAQASLREILEARAASVPALLAMERILRVQGRLEDLVPLVRAALEEDPRSALLNQLMVRTHSALDQVRDLEMAAQHWIATVPNIEIPYREVAQVWEARGDFGRARSVLADGRRRIGRDDALALEFGDLYAGMGESRLAVREWDRAVGPEARGLSQVRRRLRAQEDGGAALLPALIDLLMAEPASMARLEAAVDLAVDAGLGERAERVARRVLPSLSAPERARFLIDVARRADGARLSGLAFWAYGELIGAEAEEGRRLAIRNRLAELALELGDTARAAANYEAVEAAYAEGTPQRRQAAALRIELMAGQSLDEAATALQAFRQEYHDAPELDRLATAVAGALADAGRSEDAEDLLAGVRGPRSGLLRGRIALERGSVEDARLAFMAAAPGLRGAEATGTLQLVTLLGRVSDDGGRLLGQAMRLNERGEAGAAVDRVVEELDALPSEDGSALLEFAADMAAVAGLPEDARAMRRRLLADFPKSREAPTALLELARSLRQEDGGLTEAREHLERLIIEYPRSALVPQARRELQQLEASAGEPRKEGISG
ncbi:MAG TPA: tetratricopeptide repeat protein [Longimicrobiales bacterium]|nr:tetratricopeptide repeat protein [Longimicrobiales bacterium]